MYRIPAALSIPILLLASCTAGTGQATRSPGVHETRVGEYVISGPYAHENLAVFLIHGPDRLKGKNYLTLQEAMEQKKAVVHETGNVNELAIENVSNEDVYVQAGDIVHGGQQDRTLGTDLVLAAHSGKVPIASYCVEHGRWTARGTEPAAVFVSSSNSLSSNDLKLAVKYSNSQQQVWSSVAQEQDDLAKNLGRPVAAGSSPSSLDLTLEHENVKGAKAGYDNALRKIIDNQPDAVGYVFAINSQVTCADIYAGPSLLRRLWPKLLDASVVEAMAHRGPGATTPKDQPTTDDVKKFFADADRAAASQKEISKRTQLTSRDGAGCVLFETMDRDAGQLVHRNYLRKPAAAPRAPATNTPPSGQQHENRQNLQP